MQLIIKYYVTIGSVWKADNFPHQQEQRIYKAVHWYTCETLVSEFQLLITTITYQFTDVKIFSNITQITQDFFLFIYLGQKWAQLCLSIRKIENWSRILVQSPYLSYRKCFLVFRVKYNIIQLNGWHSAKNVSSNCKDIKNSSRDIKDNSQKTRFSKRAHSVTEIFFCTHVLIWKESGSGSAIIWKIRSESGVAHKKYGSVQ